MSITSRLRIDAQKTRASQLNRYASKLNEYFLGTNMVNLKRIMVSGLFAIAISCLQVWASIHFSKTILWQVQLMQSFVGKGPILGYRNGLPLYEATPVHMISTYIG